jgi:hypothetical protein
MYNGRCVYGIERGFLLGFSDSFTHAWQCVAASILQIQ